MSYLMLSFAAVHLGLMAWSFTWADKRSWRMVLLWVMLFGMVYDNLAQFSGQWFVGQAWFESANLLRYIIHAGALPFLTLFALSVMRACDIPLARKMPFTGFCHLFIACALAWGLYHEVYMQQLQPASDYGIDRLVSQSKLPPIATIATNILLLPLAAIIWRASGWSWLFLGSLFIFLLNGSTGSQPWGFIVGNFGEVVFISSLLATERWLSNKT
jgi:hypothetical protein